MGEKRTLPDVYKLKKKLHIGGNARTNIAASSTQDGSDLSIESTLIFLKSLFSVEVFENRLPPIIMKHQFYSVINNRTEVDKKLDSLQAKGSIRMFRLGQEDDQIAIVEMNDYIAHIENTSRKNNTLGNFIKLVVLKCPDLSYTKSSLLQKHNFGDEDITVLIQHGVLTVRDVGSMWLSIPRVGEFVKVFHRGRAAVLSILKRTKYKEMLQHDLEERKLPKKAKLTMGYHIHDIIGAELVQRFETSSGKMLRLKDPDLM